MPQPPEEDEESLYEPNDTSFDSFIQGENNPVTSMSKPHMDQWDVS